jgi:RNA:NAD 2'-phosphotransferase (TPT1/KptA family)
MHNSANMRTLINLIESSVNSRLKDSEQTEIFYHGTTKDRLPTILKNGLDPKLSQCADDEANNWTDEDNAELEFPEPTPLNHHFIFLSHSGDFSRDWIEHHGDNGVMLKITVPKFFSDQFIYHRGEFIRCPLLIPPKYIQVLS